MAVIVSEIILADIKDCTDQRVLAVLALFSDHCERIHEKPMAAATKELFWWCSVHLRISHPTLDPVFVSDSLKASAAIAQLPGESKIPHGDCKSAGYWCTEYKVEYPVRPDALISWAENFTQERESQLARMLKDGCHINFYVGVHTQLLALGFDLPPTPTIWKLKIPMGIEFFSK